MRNRGLEFVAPSGVFEFSTMLILPLISVKFSHLFGSFIVVTKTLYISYMFPQRDLSYMSDYSNIYTLEPPVISFSYLFLRVLFVWGSSLAPSCGG